MFLKEILMNVLCVIQRIDLSFDLGFIVKTLTGNLDQAPCKKTFKAIQ